MKNKITNVFFDLDDTLWDFEANSKKVLQNLFLQFELEKKLKTNAELFLTNYKVINAELWQQYYQNKITKEFLRFNRFEKVFNFFNYTNYNLNVLCSNYYLTHSPQGTILKPNTIQLLNYLKPNYKLHIITNGFKDVQHIKINVCNLGHYFDNIIISEEHNTTKPNKKIFEIAEQLSKSEAKNNLMVGDNYESDVQGAINAGWEAVWFTELNDTPHIKSIKDLIELKEFL